VELQQCTAIALQGPKKQVCHASQKMVVGIEAFRGFVLGPFDFGLFRLGRYRSHYARCYLILKIENVRQIPVEMVCPKMGTCRAR
jgi:hypothetical protein